jgi:hypothetical protein
VACPICQTDRPVAVAVAPGRGARSMVEQNRDEKWKRATSRRPSTLPSRSTELMRASGRSPDSCVNRFELPSQRRSPVANCSNPRHSQWRGRAGVSPASRAPDPRLIRQSSGVGQVIALRVGRVARQGGVSSRTFVSTRKHATCEFLHHPMPRAVYPICRTWRAWNGWSIRRRMRQSRFRYQRRLFAEPLEPIRAC